MSTVPALLKMQTVPVAERSTVALLKAMLPGLVFSVLVAGRVPSHG